MAIVAGDEVALTSPLNIPAYGRRGNVLFGVAIVVDAPGGPTDVLWENGQRTDDIPQLYLDKIVGRTAAATSRTGRVVRYSAVDSPELYGAVARQYTRQVAGEGSNPEFILYRTKDGQMVEVLESDALLVQGQ